MTSNPTNTAKHRQSSDRSPRWPIRNKDGDGSIDPETIQSLFERVTELEETVEQQQQQIDTLESEKRALEARVEAQSKKLESLTDQVAELQTKELEKGYHLRRENVETSPLYTDKDLEIFHDDEEHIDKARLVGAEAPSIDREQDDEEPADDLLPIQQLARMDDDLLSQATPTKANYYAAKIWQKRDEKGSMWKKGSKKVRQYLEAGEVARWIANQENGNVSRESSREYARRTLQALNDLSRGAFTKKQTSKRNASGLPYKETRFILERDVEIPGEDRSVTTGTDSAPATGVVTGD